MLWLIQGIWEYRAELALAIQVIAALRKTAQEITRDYIRKKIATKLKESLLVVGGQISLLLIVLFWNTQEPSLAARLVASCVLWVMTAYNLSYLVLVTIPELRALHRTLKGKVGYALKYLLEISLVTELMRLNVLILVFCLAVGISSRTYLGTCFSYTKPWVQLFGGHARIRSRPALQSHGRGVRPARR